MSYPNGKIPISQLGSIGNGLYLEKNAAKAFNELNSYIQKIYGRRLSVGAAYRNYSRQVWFWNLYNSGRGNLAARPGTSNHGVGKAIDLGDQWSRTMIDRHGARYGFSKSWSDAYGNGPGTSGYEWWHILYRHDKYNPPESIYTHLTKEEKALVLELRYLRKKAGGSWEKHPDLLKRAVIVKRKLKDRANVLRKLDLSKLHRGNRLRIISETLEG